MSKNNKTYLPEDRTGYAPSKNALVSESAGGVDSKLANTVEDPVVVNNIACSEFDYTDESNVND